MSRPSFKPAILSLEDRLALAADLDDTLATSRPLNFSAGPAQVADTIDAATDVDMYRINVRAGDRVWFDIDTPLNGVGGLGSYLRVFDAAGRELAANNDAQAPDEVQPPPGHVSYTQFFDAFIDHTFATAGTYYVGVSNWQNTYYDPRTGADGAFFYPAHLTGAYTLTVSVRSRPPEVTVVSAETVAAGRIGFTYRADGLAAGFEVGLYASADRAFDPGDVPVGGITVAPANGAWGEAVISAPRSPATADRPFLLLVADPRNQLGERDRTDNAAVVRQVTAAQLAAVSGNPAAAYTDVAPLNNAMLEYGIVTPAQQSAFLAQVMAETGNLRSLTEAGGPAYFRRAYGHRADIIPPRTTSVDQWYIGRGFIQLTGRDNYAAASRALFGDDRLVRQPAFVASNLDVAARSAAWYWSARSFQGQTLNDLSQTLTVEAFRRVSVLVNGSSPTMTAAMHDGRNYPNGWMERQVAYQRALEVLYFGRDGTNRVARVGNVAIENVDDVRPRPGTGWEAAANADRRAQVSRGLGTTLSAVRLHPPGVEAQVWYSTRVGGRWVTGLNPVAVTVGRG